MKQNERKESVQEESGTGRNDSRQELDVHPIVAQIINRDCHVGSSNRSVIRHVVSKLRHGFQTYRAMSKEDRRVFMRQCIQQHRENRELYQAVMYPSYRSAAEEDER